VKYMEIKIRTMLVFLTLVALTGIAMALGEVLNADVTGAIINVQAYNFQIPANEQLYQIRYYPPGQSVPGGTYYSNPPFKGLAIYDMNYPKTDSYNVGNVSGLWTVALFKGVTSNSKPDEITYLRKKVPVNVPIPEFPTIAFPVAAVLAIIFFIQNRKKEE
jgi:hypothetical protein